MIVVFEMSIFTTSKERFIGIISLFCFTAADALAQAAPSTAESQSVDSSGGGIGLTMILVLLVVAAGGYILWRLRSAPASDGANSYANSVQGRTISRAQEKAVGAEKERERLETLNRSETNLDRRSRDPKDSKTAAELAGLMQNGQGYGDELQAQAKAFQEKMRRSQFAQLPINSFVKLTDPRRFDPLPLSSDPALTNAIEQAGEEFEDDESIREASVRVLAAFRTRNSVEALSQIALYDLSAAIRSKAVTALTEFDHESVFEAILLACADPTREVRAAAARGLFRLNFDRADAWKRIIATKDEYRMIHAARAATEAGIVLKSFERLLHDDMKIAYEAFALVGLLIKAGETEQIFSTICDSNDERLRLALLHVISVVKDGRSLVKLERLSGDSRIPADLSAKILAVSSSRELLSA